MLAIETATGALIGTIVTVAGMVIVAIIQHIGNRAAKTAVTHAQVAAANAHVAAEDVRQVRATLGELNGEGPVQEQLATQQRQLAEVAGRQLAMQQRQIDVAGTVADLAVAVSDALEKLGKLEAWSESHEGMDSTEFGSLHTTLAALHAALDELNTYTHDFKHATVNEQTRTALAAEVLGHLVERIAVIERTLSAKYPDAPGAGP